MIFVQPVSSYNYSRSTCFNFLKVATEQVYHEHWTRVYIHMYILSLPLCFVAYCWHIYRIANHSKEVSQTQSAGACGGLNMYSVYTFLCICVVCVCVRVCEQTNQGRYCVGRGSRCPVKSGIHWRNRIAFWWRRNTVE